MYSDLGADVLGFTVEAITGQGLDAFLMERVFTPLGMSDTHFQPAAALRDRIAPTEVSSPRGYANRGEVHDENAWALGGVAGKAGVTYVANAGIALETQHFPDSPNRPSFPNTILRPDEGFTSRTVYRFSVT